MTPPNPSGNSAATPTAAPLGVEAPIGTVPWSQVGPGWTIAMWSPAAGTRPGEQPPPGQPTYANSPTTLFLVDPAGGRYVITTLPAPTGKSRPALVDWSAEGGGALMYEGYSSPPVAVSVDLHTGAQTTIPIARTDSSGGVNSTVRYSRPDGKAVLLSTGFVGSTPGTLKRLDVTGKPQQSYDTDRLGGAGQFSGNYLQSADGTQLVLSTANLGNQLVPRTDNSLVVLRSNDGQVVRKLSAPMPEARCLPVRWWNPTVVLAHCTSLKTSANQLWELPLDGSGPTALTAVNSGKQNDPGFGSDLGDVDAWQLVSGTFLQSEGACGSSFLSRPTSDGHSTKVNVSGLDNQTSVHVIGVGADNSKLVLEAAPNCGQGSSLLTYDPTANASTVLLGPPLNGGSVIAAQPYPAS